MTVGPATAAAQARWDAVMLGNYGLPPLALALPAAAPRSPPRSRAAPPNAPGAEVANAARCCRATTTMASTTKMMANTTTTATHRSINTPLSQPPGHPQTLPH